MVSGPTNGWYYVKLANGTYGYASASYVTTGTVSSGTAAIMNSTGGASPSTPVSTTSPMITTAPSSLFYTPSSISSTMSLDGDGVSPLTRAIEASTLGVAILAAKVLLSEWKDCPVALQMLLLSLQLTDSSPPSLSSSITNMMVPELCSSSQIIESLRKEINKFSPATSFSNDSFSLILNDNLDLDFAMNNTNIDIESAVKESDG